MKQAILTNLKSCSMRRNLLWGRRIHAKSVECCYDSDIYVATTLIKLYAKCSSMTDARRLFDSIENPNVVAWTALLLGYAETGEGHIALDLFSRMKIGGWLPDCVTYVAALKACTSLAVTGDSCQKEDCLKQGKEIHSEIGCHLDYYVENMLIGMYAKCRSMVDARRVFDNMQMPNVVSWSALLLGYAEIGEGDIALNLFSRMKAQGCVPNSVTYLAALKACTSLETNGDSRKVLERGREIHSEIGVHIDHFVQCALIDMYTKCGSIVDARDVFDSIRNPDVVTWNALLMGYADSGEGYVALDLFSKMKAGGSVPDSVSYVAILKACTSLALNGEVTGKTECLDRGRVIHSEIGSRMDHHVQNTLIDMYTKCGSIVDARNVFDSIQKPNVVSWNALLLGYIDHGQGRFALDLFSRMKSRGCIPNPVTYLAALKACTSLVNGDGSGKGDCLERGREIHSEIGCHMDLYVQNTLIDMYAKCGCMVEARHVFDSIDEPSVVSWNSLLLGYADNGEGYVALDLFSRMKASGCVPNSVTYISALKSLTSLAVDVNGCGRDDFLERGREIHSEIGSHLNHYVEGSLIDMYAKCGSMAEARQVFDSIQNPNVASWTALLLGYTETGEGHVALDLLSKMKAHGCAPDSVAYMAGLKACGSTGALNFGRKFHSEITEFNTHVVTCLVDFYAKCGSMEEAREVFDLHSKARDVTTWTALLAGYARCGDTGTVFNLFVAMQDEGLRPDAVTFVCLLLCCSHAGLVKKAKEYFEAMTVQYKVIPSVMHYNCMVDVLGRANQLNEAVLMIRKMPCNPDAVTWTSLLGACRKWRNVEIARGAFQALADMEKRNVTSFVLMANIYGSRGMWEEQERVLESARTSLCDGESVS